MRTVTVSSSRGIDLSRPWVFPAAHEDAVQCRRHPRSPVRVPVEIRLFREDGSSSDRGSGVIRDLSDSGLRLDDISLAKGRILAEHCRIELRPAHSPHDAPGVTGRVLRSTSSGLSGFGIEFLDSGSGAEAQLRGWSIPEAAPAAR